MRVAILYNLIDSRTRGLAADAAAENEILATVEGAVGALEREHQVVALRVDARLLAALRRGFFDVVLNLAEGLGDRPDTEHLIPAALEIAGIPCTGSPAFALDLCRDKVRTKQLLVGGGLPTPEFVVVGADGVWPSAGLPLPCIVKPAYEDASVGIEAASIVETQAALAERIGVVTHRYRQPALVERYVAGREINAAVLGAGAAAEVLPLSEILFIDGAAPIVTFAAKWNPESVDFRGTPGVCPAQLPEAVGAEIRRLALAAFELTGCRDYARVDFRLDGDRPLIIDVNPNPAIDAQAGFFRSARAAGLSYSQLLERILAMAAARGLPEAPPTPSPISDRLTAGRAMPSDLDLLLGWFNDPEIGRTMDDPQKRYTRDELAAALFVHAAPTSLDLVVRLRSDGRPVGYCGLYDIDQGRGVVTFLVGDPELRGRGLGREMLDLLLRAAFGDEGLDAVTGTVLVDNLPSVRALRGARFREVGRLAGSHRGPDGREDELLFELTRTDWAGR